MEVTTDDLLKIIGRLTVTIEAKDQVIATLQARIVQLQKQDKPEEDTNDISS